MVSQKDAFIFVSHLLINFIFRRFQSLIRNDFAIFGAYLRGVVSPRPVDRSDERQ